MPRSEAAIIYSNKKRAIAPACNRPPKPYRHVKAFVEAEPDRAGNLAARGLPGLRGWRGKQERGNQQRYGKRERDKS
jgi:hypothetical protein